MRIGICIADYAKGSTKTKYTIKFTDNSEMYTYTKDELKQLVSSGSLFVQNMSLSDKGILREVDPTGQIGHYKETKEARADVALDSTMLVIQSILEKEGVIYKLNSKGAFAVGDFSGDSNNTHMAYIKSADKGVAAEIHIIGKGKGRAIMQLQMNTINVQSCETFVRSIVGILKENGKVNNRVKR
jgi:hypothetical protein